jgi:hypothetical protein
MYTLSKGVFKQTMNFNEVYISHNVHIGSGAQIVSSHMRNRGSFGGGKAAGACSRTLTSTQREVKNAWSYTFTLP